MITDTQGNAVSPVVLGDDKYSTLDEALVDGKTLADLTNKQLVYLLSTVTDQLRANLLANELAFRVKRPVDKTDWPEDED